MSGDLRTITAGRFIEVRREYERAVSKHPDFPTPGTHPLQIILEELGEVCEGLISDDISNALSEVDQTCVTLERWGEIIRSGVNAKFVKHPLMPFILSLGIMCKCLNDGNVERGKIYAESTLELLESWIDTI